MKVGSFVLVMKKSSELYRRRCEILEIITLEDGTLAYTVYSEGLEQKETLPATEVEPSKF